jgi:hypothetical protein
MDSKMCRLTVKVKPRSPRDAVEIGPGGGVTLRVQSPPVDDRANADAVRLLAARLGVPRSSCTIVRGGRSRIKQVEIRGLDQGSVRRRLEPTAERTA